MPKNTPTKSRLSPRSAKKVGPVPAAKGHKPRAAPKSAVSRTRVAKPAKAPRVRRGDEVVELLQRKDGATIAEMVTRFGLQPHTLRAIISVEGRKRGLKVQLVGKAHYRVL